MFAFHTASFMTDAIALYERLGFRRAPEFDFDMAARYGGTGAAPITALAYLRQLAPTAPRARILGGSDDNQHSHPAGQLARLLPGPSGGPLAGRVHARPRRRRRDRAGARPADRASCASEVRGPAADLSELTNDGTRTPYLASRAVGVTITAAAPRQLP